MSTKHTAGPFPMGPSDSKFNGESRCGKHRWGMDCPPGWRTVQPKYCAECKRLAAAAASELLEACENAIGQFNQKECNCDGEYVDGRLVGHTCYFHRIEQDLKQAIAKATGGKS